MLVKASTEEEAGSWDFTALLGFSGSVWTSLCQLTRVAPATVVSPGSVLLQHLLGVLFICFFLLDRLFPLDMI